MGRDPIRNQTPDLFSTERLGGPSSDRPENAVTERPSRRTALPKDLPKAIRYLEDRELDWLVRAATEEAKRRGRPMPMNEASPTNTPAASSEPIPKQTKPPGRPTHQRQIRPAAASLSRGRRMRSGPRSRPGSHRHGLPDNSACLNRMFARHFRPMNPSDDGPLYAPQELTGHRSTKATSWKEIARSALANYQRTSLFLCSVSFLLFRAYDAKRTRGHEMGKSQKWHGVKPRPAT